MEMGKPAARITDPTARGGILLVGEPTVTAGDRPVSRVTNDHLCPRCGAKGPVVPPTTSNVLVKNLPPGRIGDKTFCGCGQDTIVGGEATVLIGAEGQAGAGAGKADEAEDARWTVEGIKAEMAKTSVGRKLLSERRLDSVAFKAGDLSAMNMVAGYFPGTNSLMLPPGLSNVQAANLAVHELTHAQQFASGLIPADLLSTPMAGWPEEFQQVALQMEREAWENGFQDWVQRGVAEFGGGFLISPPEVPGVEEGDAGAFSRREHVGKGAFDEGLDAAYSKAYGFDLE